MAIGISVVLLALGAVLIWGTGAAVGGVEVSTVGIILMVVGIVGIVATLLYGPERADERFAVRRRARSRRRSSVSER